MKYLRILFESAIRSNPSLLGIRLIATVEKLYAKSRNREKWMDTKLNQPGEIEMESGDNWSKILFCFPRKEDEWFDKKIKIKRELEYE